MFKNLSMFRIGAQWDISPEDAEDKLRPMRFIECGATQMKSMGWIEPRGIKHGSLLETVGRHWLLRLFTEKKDLPGAVVKRRVDEIVAEIEKREGRKPGRKEKREIKEAAVLELLPKAFTKQSAVNVWIDRDRRLLFIDTSSPTRADEIVTFLAHTFEGIEVTMLQTSIAPSTLMADWLSSGETPEGFEMDGECELKSTDDMKSTVRYARHRLDIVEVREHIQSGKVPQMLSVSWRGRVSFVLNSTLQIKKIKFLDLALEDGGDNAGNDSAFDADVAIATGELSQMVPDLIEVLGGEVKLDL